MQGSVRAGECACRGVRTEVELADGDAHAPCAEITEAEDAAAIGEDDAVAHVLAVCRATQRGRRVLLEHLLHLPLVGDAHVCHRHRHTAVDPHESRADSRGCP